jgi:hypothetical protein
MLLAGFMPAVSQSLTLSVDNVTLPENGAEVRFSALEVGTERISGQDAVGQSEHFRLYLGVRGGFFDPDSRLFKYNLLTQRVGDSADATRWEVKAESVGQFPDQFRDLHFRLTGAGVEDNGTLRLALHSVKGGSELVWKPDSDVFEVELGGDRRLPLQVENTLPEMTLTIKNIYPSYRDASLWAGGSPQVLGGPSATGPALVVPEATGKAVKLADVVVRANPWHVVQATFFSGNRREQTRVPVVITYAVQSGGRERNLEFEVPIRFVPTLWVILLALLLGSGLGMVVRLTEKKKRATSRAWWSVWLAGLAGAVLADLVGVVLVYYGSKFVLLKFELDPYNIPQVALMAALVAWRGLEYVGLKKLISKEAG